MNIFSFDNTFQGLLTLVFDCYQKNCFPDEILCGEGGQPVLFSSTIHIQTDDTKAERVWKGIVARSSQVNAHRIYRVFLSELPHVPMLLVKYMRLVIDSRKNEETNFSEPVVVEVNKLHQKVCKEAHRIEMFVRFQKTVEGSYYASFAPMYDVLSLTIPHFKDRYADQPWIIYDLKRNYGFWYDLKDIARVTFDDLKVNTQNGQLHASLLAEDEKHFQQLWKQYYHSICITERKNDKVHRQLLPQRFWKYLPEKGVL
ncbi:MAG TPA: TIGR03915 family putative DNA repair protein [Prolixibacteraceae bacterium]|nr:TIGR03915 family putative DNA repair protein [Prolixibacteraceae bacterium]